MLPLAQLNYLLRHSGANGAAGSADLKKHRFNASHIQQLDTGPGRRCCLVGPPGSRAGLDLTFC